MNIYSWFLYGSFFWIGGFFLARSEAPIPELKSIWVPKWLFILLGAPKYRNVPAGVMDAVSVYGQSLGLSLIFYGLCLDDRVIKDPGLSALIGILQSFFLNHFVFLYLLKHRPYKWPSKPENNEQ